jgi:phosphoribosylanthranilate isomerase
VVGLSSNVSWVHLRHAGTVHVQVYGVTTVDDAAGVNSLRPDSVGVVLDEGIPTWDSVDDATMRGIVAELTNVDVVALSLSTDPARVLRTAALVEPAIMHLARAVDGLGVDGVARLRSDLQPVRVMVTIAVRDATCVDVAQRFAEVADFLLLDTMHPSTGIVGATGLVHDWSWSKGIVASVATPTFLAGGLGPDNVRDAIELVRPFGVDSETKTSTVEDRRRKDLEQVERFIRLARATVDDVPR